MQYFSKHLLAWYELHGRKDLPWQHEQTPYRVWVSEIMLQQTQVKTVIPYYARFMESFPDVATLASASEELVLQHWAGLGYYSRGRNLLKAAQMVMQDFDGIFPDNLEDLMQLPGIGRSTAGAISAFAFKQRIPILDGNVKRVLTRFQAIAGYPSKPEIEKRLWTLADELTPKQHIAEYTQAIMDLGATLCTRTKPKCEQCPVAKKCEAYLRNEIHLYPEKKPKKKTPIKTTHFLIPMMDKQVLLHKRPSPGIWGGLWSFIECEQFNPDAVATQYAQQYGFTFNKHAELPPIHHTFSHYKLIATPILLHVNKRDNIAMENDTHLWHDIAQTGTLGTATPVKKLLTQLIEEYDLCSV